MIMLYAYKLSMVFTDIRRYSVEQERAFFEKDFLEPYSV